MPASMLPGDRAKLLIAYGIIQSVMESSLADRRR